MTFPIPQIELESEAESFTPTIRQQIVDQFDAALRTISRDNGFQTDVGSQVFEWYAVAFDPAQFPLALIWRDLDEPIEEPSNNAFRHKRSLHMQVEIIAVGPTAPKIYRRVLADVEKAIFSGYNVTTQEWWGGLAYKTRPRLARMVVEQASQKVAGGFYECFIDYAARAFDSYELET